MFLKVKRKMLKQVIKWGNDLMAQFWHYYFMMTFPAFNEKVSPKELYMCASTAESRSIGQLIEHFHQQIYIHQHKYSD